jgi:hypothetical protein
MAQQQQQQQRKFVSCRKCQQPITFDNAHKSQSGKFIPLQTDSIGQLQAHQCPNREKQQQQQPQQQQFSRSELADLQDEITELKAHVKSLITQVQLMRQELQ